MRFNAMRIGKPEIIERDARVTYQVEVARDGGRDTSTLWYQIPSEHAESISDRADAAVVALLMPAMRWAREINVEGAFSEQLYYNLGRFQRIMAIMDPRLRPVKINAPDVRPTSGHGSGVATGFSCGIDSFCVLADHYYAETLPGFRLTHLLYNNIGSHGIGGQSLFRERHARAAVIAERTGLPLVAVDSNLDTFYAGCPSLDFIWSHTPRNVSVALFLQRGIGRFMYASAYSYGQILTESIESIAHCDPILLPLLGTESFNALAVGSEYSRVEKTLRVAEVPDSYDALDVCANPRTSGNCSACWKCMRTLVTLEIAGMLDRYDAVFDLERYRQSREEYLLRLGWVGGLLENEIVAFARERGYPLPGRLRIWTGLSWRWFRAKARSLRQRARRMAGVREQSANHTPEVKRN